VETLHQHQYPIDDDYDGPAILGILVGMAAMAMWLLSIMVPVLPWILSGILGLIMLPCGMISKSPVRWKILLVGVLSLIPFTIFVLVQSIPTWESIG
jgi:hypothetical protein